VGSGILVKRRPATSQEWLLVVVRTASSAYVTGPVAVAANAADVELTVPPEARRQEWWAEVYLTDRPPERIEELSDRESSEEPIVVRKQIASRDTDG